MRFFRLPRINRGLHDPSIGIYSILVPQLCVGLSDFTIHVKVHAHALLDFSLENRWVSGVKKQGHLQLSPFSRSDRARTVRAPGFPSLLQLSSVTFKAVLDTKILELQRVGSYRQIQFKCKPWTGTWPILWGMFIVVIRWAQLSRRDEWHTASHISVFSLINTFYSVSAWFTIRPLCVISYPFLIRVVGLQCKSWFTDGKTL